MPGYSGYPGPGHSLSGPVPRADTVPDCQTTTWLVVSVYRDLHVAGKMPLGSKVSMFLLSSLSTSIAPSGHRRYWCYGRYCNTRCLLGRNTNYRLQVGRIILSRTRRLLELSESHADLRKLGPPAGLLAPPSTVTSRPLSGCRARHRSAASVPGRFT